MDNPEEFRILEWCAGYGGIGLGLKRAIPNMRTIAFSEIEAYACANLVAKMEAGLLDSAPIWTDIKTFPSYQFRGKIDMLIAGYPCQPFSTAGKRMGKEDPRHLWPYIREHIKTIRPVFCFFENVEGHLSLGFREVQQSLRRLGYGVEAGIFSASECGAPHQRKRLFILAYNSSEGLERLRERGYTERRKEQDGHAGSGCEVWPARPGQEQYEWEPPRTVENTISTRPRYNIGEARSKSGWEDVRQGDREELPVRVDSASPDTERTVGDTKHHGSYESTQPRSTQETSYNNEERPDTTGELAGAGRPGSGADLSGGERKPNRQVKREMGRNFDGCSYRLDNAELYESCDNRTDELRLLGNGVVPATAEKAFRVLLNKIIEGAR